MSGRTGGGEKGSRQKGKKKGREDRLDSIAYTRAFGGLLVVFRDFMNLLDKSESSVVVDLDGEMRGRREGEKGKETRVLLVCVGLFYLSCLVVCLFFEAHATNTRHASV